MMYAPYPAIRNIACISSVALLFGLASHLAVAADVSDELKLFDGIWKEDLSQSRNTPSRGALLAIERQPDGSLSEKRGTGPGTMTYTFRIDGKEYPLEGFSTITWRETGPNTWESQTKRNGIVTGMQRRMLSGDGTKLSVTLNYPTPGGMTPVTTYEYQRTGGDSKGLVGTWRRVAEKSHQAGTREVRVAGTGELTSLDLGSKAKFTARHDGKDYPYTGPSIRPGITVSLVRVGPRTVREVFKRNGQPISEATLVVSQDGKTLTQTNRDLNTNDEVSTTVYIRQ